MSSRASNLGEQRKALPPLDPALFEAPEMCAALAEHKIGDVYRLLTDRKDGGISQHEIARRTGQSQSEVCEILKGRKVGMYGTLVRVCEGLGAPREVMGLSFGPGGAYAGGVTVADPPEGDAEMRRRHLLATAGIALVGQPVKHLGELLELPGPSPVELPSRLGWHQVSRVRDVTRHLRETGNAYGSDPELASETAAWATRLLTVPGAEPVKQELVTAVAALHLEAGWSAFDGGRYEQAMYHCTRGLELATQAGDPYYQTLALNYAGLATLEDGNPDDGLKMLQLGQVKSSDIPRDLDRNSEGLGAGSRVGLEACGLADSATALFALGETESAHRHLGRSRELWRPTPTAPAGDLDIVTANAELDRGRLDAAEPFATASVRRWQSGGSERARSRASVVRATIHVQAGDTKGLGLADGAITAVAKLSSVRNRKRLAPLADALEDRPGSDTRELAHRARQVATLPA
ncbi:MAG: hypothetical protein GEU83_20960 [Pseudonocardiaceae bacterium]|nr:hypothetical protein [Pseudonocardiaceae bacterium]